MPIETRTTAGRLSVSIWRFSFQACPPFGATGLWLVRYQPGGARHVLIREALSSLHIANKDFINETRKQSGGGVRIFREEDSDVLNSFAELGATACVPSGAPVLLIHLSQLLRMLPMTASHYRIMDSLRLAQESEPPPTANFHTTRTGYQQAPPPGFPALDYDTQGEGDLGENLDDDMDDIIPPPLPVIRPLVPRLLKAKGGR